MALTRHTESDTVFLQVKHFSLWREIKKAVEGCEEIEVTNPKTGAKVVKYGYRFRAVQGRVVKIVKYDTGDKYATRYFGFKVTLKDGPDVYVLDMPYNSQILRRFLRVAPNVDWRRALSITIFKGKSEKKDGGGETGVWFQQGDETVKPYYTRENPNGMPSATQDPDTHDWDFRAQHRWLIAQLIERIVPVIENEASKAAPPAELGGEDTAPAHDAGEYEPSDDDVPFRRRPHRRGRQVKTDENVLQVWRQKAA